jgi:magnesium chelatase subunit H
VPPYGRAGLYLELANLKDLVEEFRTNISSDRVDKDLFQTIYGLAKRSGMTSDVPLLADPKDDSSMVKEDMLPDDLQESVMCDWVRQLADYLNVLQDRLFSSGLHVLGLNPSDEELNSYLEAYFGDKLSEQHRDEVIRKWRKDQVRANSSAGFLYSFLSWLISLGSPEEETILSEDSAIQEATEIVSLLSKSNEEVHSVLTGLDGGYIKPGPGGDLLRDGKSVLPTGRNIHALDPYRMPSATAWARGQRAADEIIRQHREKNNGRYPETVAVTLWGLDAIKTCGESVAIALALVGAQPVKEGTGRIVRYDLVPLEELGRPRIDVLASLSGIFR